MLNLHLIQQMELMTVKVVVLCLVQAKHPYDIRVVLIDNLIVFQSELIGLKSLLHSLVVTMLLLLLAVNDIRLKARMQ